MKKKNIIRIKDYQEHLLSSNVHIKLPLLSLQRSPFFPSNGELIIDLISSSPFTNTETTRKTLSE
jgi:hypothetical protein